VFPRMLGRGKAGGVKNDGKKADGVEKRANRKKGKEKKQEKSHLLLRGEGLPWPENFHGQGSKRRSLFKGGVKGESAEGRTKDFQ